MEHLREVSDATAMKAEMFCTSCGFAGRMDEDYVIDVDDTELRYVCPECGTVLTRRPLRA
ncbi:MAG: hypothetical protein ABEH64_12835 [Salinirussus sp.]